MQGRIGWYVYTPQDVKKSRLCLRWSSVQDYWLEISTKPSEPPMLTVHLGFCVFSPVKPEERAKFSGMPINTLMVTTTFPYGEFPCPLFLGTHNRFDILDLNDALVAGKASWEQYLSQIKPDTDLGFRENLKDKKASLLGAKSLECSILPTGFQTVKSATESTTFDFGNIGYVRPVPFDNRQGLAFEMKLKQGVKPDGLLLECHDHAELRRLLSILYFHLRTLQA
jgi:hypothetical protein